jgi:tetratricopeptide (TPR) repeat protein
VTAFDPNKAFREAGRALSLAQGFTLFPIPIEGPDIARALGEWLATQGHEVSTIEPLDDEAWQHIVATLFDVPPHPRRVVLVIGGREPANGVYAGLRLLNQRRDTVARHLSCPLLWCGPPELLKLTWERAPDFWSVRALPLHVDVPSGRASEPPLFGGAWVADPPERLRALQHSAKKQGDTRNAARAATMLAEALVARAELDDAEEALDDTAGGDEARLARATIAAMRGDASKAEAILERACDDPGLEGRRLLLLGALRASRDLLAHAVSTLHAAGDRANEAVAVADLGVLEMKDDLEAAESHLTAARAILREIGDDRNEARVLCKLGAVHLAARDSRQACEHFEDALAIFRDLGDRHGEADVLRRLARAYLELGDPEKALLDSQRAIALSNDMGDRGGKDEAEALSSRARIELDEKR